MMIPVKRISENTQVQQLAEKFREVYKDLEPQFVATAPGRVNVIGEHIDYCGYSVFPIALDRTIRMACHVDKKSTGLRLTNVDTQYKPFQSSTLDVHIDRENIQWHLYFICGYKGIADYAKAKGLTLPQMNLTVLVDGDIPPNAGLSSSSAMVVAAAIVIAHAAGIKIGKAEMASLCSKSERYIGTQGGGMDQAAALMAVEGKALLVNFKEPIEALPRLLPSDVDFVIANSLVEVNKAATAHFNRRVVECRVAAKLLVKVHGKPKTADGKKPDWRAVKTLAEAQEAVGMEDPQSVLDYVYSTLIHEGELKAGDIQETEQTKPDYEDSHGTWTRAQVLAKLECTDAEFVENCLTENTKDMTEFHVGARAKHVFSEAERAHHFADLCLSLEGNHPEVLPPEVSHEQVTHEMGNLMNKSHHSCAVFYQCSHPDVDALVQVARNSGSLGSRLTGAGWGGCTVHMVPHRKADAFVEALGLEFYDPRDLKASDAVFVCKPGSCATIFEK